MRSHVKTIIVSNYKARPYNSKYWTIAIIVITHDQLLHNRLFTREAQLSGVNKDLQRGGAELVIVKVSNSCE